MRHTPARTPPARSRATDGTTRPTRRALRLTARAATAVRALSLLIFASVTPLAAFGQEPVTDGRAAIAALSFEPLDFHMPVVEEHDVRGAEVLLLEDDALPLVTLHAYFRGGYGLFDRAEYAAAMGLPAMLRYGGTMDRTPAELDEAIALRAFQMSFGSGGGSVTSSINTLTEHLGTAVELWGEMLTRPGFDSAEIEAWRVRQLESVRRRADDPGRLAISEMNRLLYGEHPVGWEMSPDDLAPERVTPAAFRSVHRRIVCRDNLVLGFTGDIDWDRAGPLAERLLDRIPRCPDDLPEPPVPDIRRAPGVFVVEKDIEQAVIVMAHPTDVRLGDDDEYFAAVIGNSILGGGGFSSRILRRVRTEEGYAYSATSLWTTPRDHEGVVGAMTRTRPENVGSAIDVILATMSGLRDDPPTEDEVGTTVDRIVNGFVFNFDSASQIMSRSLYYRAIDLPDDWLERYLDGVRVVTGERIRSVFRDHLHPERMTILVVGDPERIGLQTLEAYGPVTILDIG